MSTYLPGVAANPQPGVYADLIDAARRGPGDYSRIWDLFAFRQDITIHLARFTEGVLRGPCSISPGLRELIAAYTSHLNACDFCTHSHAATAAALLEGGEQLVRAVLDDPEHSPLSPRDKALLRLVRTVTLDLPAVGEADVQSTRSAGWNDEAIYFAITTSALFNFYNRWVSATGVPAMTAAAHREQGRRLAEHGYIRDNK